jgi:hypothetical protein
MDLAEARRAVVLMLYRQANEVVSLEILLPNGKASPGEHR